MPKKLTSSQGVPFTQIGEDTHGLSVIREVWETEQGEEIRWKYSLPNTVQILAVTTEGQIVAVSEFQPGVGVDYLHLPGETMEQDETPIEAAIRGLREETGYESGSVELLSSILENSGRSDRLVHIVLITGCKKGEQVGEKDIETVLLSPSEFWNRLMRYFRTNPEYKHGGGNTLKAVALAFHRLGLLRLQ